MAEGVEGHLSLEAVGRKGGHRVYRDQSLKCQAGDCSYVVHRMCETHEVTHGQAHWYQACNSGLRQTEQ